jgi:hypothetical protein
MEANLNRRFNIEREQLEERIHFSLNSNHADAKWIVSLRDVTVVEEMAFVRMELLEALLQAITLRGSSERPYNKATFSMYGIEPKGIAIGQTFVLKGKILDIMSSLSGVFSSYLTKGLSKMPPAQLFGKDKEGREVMAFYIPPIIEYHRGLPILLDGIHRSYICSSAGTTINGIHIQACTVPLPFDPISWKETKLVEEKPAIDLRYRNLNTAYFRDLTHVGIDG